MSDREALATALEALAPKAPFVDERLNREVALIHAAAWERLAQLPEKCPICKGEGCSRYWRPDPCLTCHGSGKVHPAELVERIKVAVILGIEAGKEGYANAVNVDVVTRFVLDALNSQSTRETP